MPEPSITRVFTAKTLSLPPNASAARVTTVISGDCPKAAAPTNMAIAAILNFMAEPSFHNPSHSSLGQHARPLPNCGRVDTIGKYETYLAPRSCICRGVVRRWLLDHGPLHGGPESGGR